MVMLKSIFILLVVKNVLCEEQLVKPCARSDIACLSQSSEQFLEKTHKGVKEYDIKPIDPLIVPSLTKVADKDTGLLYHFKDLKVTGWKNQKISDFQMNTDTQSVVLKTKADLNIVGDIVIEFSKQSKSFNGVYSAETSVITTAQYQYEFKKDAQGVEHFEVGPETITCEVIGNPKATLNDELSQTLRTDTVAVENMPKYAENRVKITKETICEIAKLCYSDVIHNLRASAKVVPKTAFFTDL